MALAVRLINIMSERSCPASGSVGSGCPVGGGKGSRLGPRGCNFSSFSQAGDLRAGFDVCLSSVTLV